MMPCAMEVFTRMTVTVLFMAKTWRTTAAPAARIEVAMRLMARVVQIKVPQRLKFKQTHSPPQFNSHRDTGDFTS